jgi:hypothetical protein
MISFFGERLPLVIAALALILLLRVMGLKWENFFLVKGDLTAPVQGLGRKTPNLPWLPAGFLFTLIMASLFALALTQLMQPSVSWQQLFPICRLFYSLPL